MAKIYIEDEEVLVFYKEEKESGEHLIEKNNYIMRSTIKAEFKSSIFSYAQQKVLISKTNRFNEDYYKFVLFDDLESKAWNIIELSSKLDIKIKRLSPDVFIVIGDSKDGTVTSQVSFCKMKPSTKVEEIAINFSKLKAFHFLPKESILISYEDADKMNENVYHTLAMYNYEGILQKTIYEYCETDEEYYSYNIEKDKIKVTKHKRGKA